MTENRELKTEGAYRADTDNTYFDMQTLAHVNAAEGYGQTMGPVIEGEMTTVGLMKIASGVEAKLHSHPNEQWIYIIEGRARTTIDGVTREIGPGELVYFPPNCVHGTVIISEEDCLFFTCKDLRSGIKGTPVDA